MVGRFVGCCIEREVCIEFDDASYLVRYVPNAECAMLSTSLKPVSLNPL